MVFEIKDTERLVSALSNVFEFVDPIIHGYGTINVKKMVHCFDGKVLRPQTLLIELNEELTLFTMKTYELTENGISFDVIPLRTEHGPFTFDDLVTCIMNDESLLGLIDRSEIMQSVKAKGGRRRKKTAMPTDCALQAVSSLPSSTMQQFLFRISNSGGEIRKSSVTRSEQIQIDSYYESGTYYTEYTRHNKERKDVVRVQDAGSIFTGRNKTLLKMFCFTLQKIAQQNQPRAVDFSLDELVSAGMYKSTDAARRAVKEFFSQQSKIYYHKSVIVKKRNGKTEKIEGSGFLFYNCEISNGWVTLSMNEKFPLKLVFAEFYTVFPRFAYSLGSSAFSLTHYIFTLARENTRDITEHGTFNISMDAIRVYLGLPTVKELGAQNRHYDRITTPIENAIEEIEAAVYNSSAEYNGEFTITPHIPEGGNINEWLKGYITVGLSGDYVKYFSEIAEDRAKKITEYKREKTKAAAQIEAKSEAISGIKNAT